MRSSSSPSAPESPQPPVSLEEATAIAGRQETLDDLENGFLESARRDGYSVWHDAKVQREMEERHNAVIASGSARLQQMMLAMQHCPLYGASYAGIRAIIYKEWDRLQEMNQALGPLAQPVTKGAAYQSSQVVGKFKCPECNRNYADQSGLNKHKPKCDRIFLSDTYTSIIDMQMLYALWLLGIHDERNKATNALSFLNTYGGSQTGTISYQRLRDFKAATFEKKLRKPQNKYKAQLGSVTVGSLSYEQVRGKMCKWAMSSPKCFFDDVHNDVPWWNEVRPT